MPRAEKEERVKALTQQLTHSEGALLTEFRGIKVHEIQELRRQLRDAGAEFRVVKNSLGRLAVKDAGMDDLLPLFEGSTAIAFIHGDPVMAAKGLDEMAKRFPSLVIKGGIVEGKILDAARAGELAKLKPREEMLAAFAGMLSSPMRTLAVMLAAPLRSLAYSLAAYRQKAETQAPAEAAGEAESEEAPSDEVAPPAETEETAEAPEETAEAPEETAEASEEKDGSADAETPPDQSQDQEKEASADEAGEEDKEE